VAGVAAKKLIFRFQKLNFENSANCGIFKIYFPRTEKVLISCHSCHQQTKISLIINTLQNTHLQKWCRWCR